MPLTPSSAVRQDDGAGKNIKTGTDGGGDHIQFVALSDDTGAHTGISGAPLAVTGPTSGTAPISKLMDETDTLISGANPLDVTLGASGSTVDLAASAGVKLKDDGGTDISSANPLDVAVADAIPATTYVTGAALENEAVAKATAGTLREVSVVLDNAASARWFMLFDANVALVGGETPIFRAPLAAGPSLVSFSPERGISFSTGLVVATSSTIDTFTDPGDTVAAFRVDMD